MPLLSLESVSFEQLTRLWAKVVGSQIADVSRPVAFMSSTHTLYLSVSSMVWARELDRMSEDMLANLPRIDGRAVRVVRIRFTPPSLPNAPRLHHRSSPAA